MTRVQTRRRLGLGAALAACVCAAAAQAQPAPPAGGASSPAAALSMIAAVVPSTDLDRSIVFYENGLGLKAAARLEMASATEVPLFFPGGGMGLMIVKSKTPGAVLPARGMLNRVVLAVSDVGGLEARLSAAGYPLKSGPIAELQHHVVVAVAQDPDGNVLELVQRTAR